MPGPTTIADQAAEKKALEVALAGPNKRNGRSANDDRLQLSNGRSDPKFALVHRVLF